MPDDGSYDVLIAGGGPAGLAVAIGAARAGLSVLVRDRRPEVIDKACGEGLMPGALRSLQQLGVDPPGHNITGITYRQRDYAVDARFGNGPGRGVRRTELHASLQQAAIELGVAFRPGTVRAVTDHGDHVEVDGVRSRYLVGADGLHSTVRRTVGLAADGGGAIPRWGLRRHFAAAPRTDNVEVTWADHSEAYVTPIAADTVGVAILSCTRAGFAEQLAAFPELASWLSAHETVSTVRGAGPLRQRVTGRVAGRVLLVGDSAGYVDALTGEGLALALAAAAELVSCLIRDAPGDYERAWRRISRRSRWLTEGLLWARTHRLTARRVVPLAARAPRLFAAAVDQLAG